MSSALERLNARVDEELAVLDYPSRDWLPPVVAPDGMPAWDVVIVGAGQSGLAAGFALQREKVGRVLLLDRAPAGREGPWVTFARMHTLRTPKHVLGPDLGVPSLTAAQWFRAVHGAQAWERITKLPREDWMAYLVWLRERLGLRIDNGVDVTGFEACDADRRLLAIATVGAQGARTLYARRLVFATGIDGAGGWAVPDFVRDGLPRERWSHTSEAIDFDRLAGLRLGVLGAGASAFDNAATAMEAGAASVDLFYRRAHLPRVNPYRWMENAGFLGHFADMPDPWKWAFYRRILDGNQPPPQDTFERCTRQAAFRLHPGEPWRSVCEVDGEVQVTTSSGSHRFDHLIIGTGLAFDLALRPELGRHAGAVATWADRFAPAADEPNPALRNLPYLGPGYELLERRPGTQAWAGKVHHFSWGATLSMGVSTGALSGLKYGVRRLASALVRSLYLEDLPAFYEDFAAYAEPELTIPEHL